ncbi:MAG TPA: ABC transporter permease subunit, partial [Candidatus Bathyarchaeia archaeon]|nr:ABC transporter permease subunit [Candidatus Bathyarchaeia archaeon]
LPHARRMVPFMRTVGGVAAIGAKELRGRMRGRRAFVIVTIYLALLGGFAWMVATLIMQSYTSGFGGSSAFASAAIGQGIFAALLMLETLQVAFLTPSSTAGAISLEREKQTLELLIATPISSFAIVLGKLLSALVYVFLLIAASLPLMAIVFVYGGVGPEDVLRGYVVLIATAIGLGSFGLFCSTLVRRTTAATAITIFGVLTVTIGTIFILGFWSAMGSFDNNGNRQPGPLGIRSPEPLAWVNPFVAQADVLCGTDTNAGGIWCSGLSALVPTDGIVFVGDGTSGSGAVPPGAVPAVPVPAPGMNGQVIAKDQVVIQGGGVVQAVPQQFAPGRDRLWPRSVATWLILSAIFLALSVQLVSPTRRWHIRRPRRPRPVAAA